jgi:hypothetical protein
MAMLVAANLDPAANILPGTLDLERKPNQHMAFSTGTHFCLGYQLARLEGRCALEALYKGWPRLELAVKPEQIRLRSWHQGDYQSASGSNADSDSIAMLRSRARLLNCWLIGQSSEALWPTD